MKPEKAWEKERIEPNLVGRKGIGQKRVKPAGMVGIRTKRPFLIKKIKLNPNERLSLKKRRRGV